MADGQHDTSALALYSSPLYGLLGQSVGIVGVGACCVYVGQVNKVSFVTIAKATT